MTSLNNYTKYIDEPNRAQHPANKNMLNKHIFAIDSRQRDFKYNPNANNYTIQVPDTYKNISSIIYNVNQ